MKVRKRIAPFMDASLKKTKRYILYKVKAGANFFLAQTIDSCSLFPTVRVSVYTW